MEWYIYQKQQKCWLTSLIIIGIIIRYANDEFKIKQYVHVPWWHWQYINIRPVILDIYDISIQMYILNLTLRVTANRFLHYIVGVWWWRTALASITWFLPQSYAPGFKSLEDKYCMWFLAQAKLHPFGDFQVPKLITKIKSSLNENKPLRLFHLVYTDVATFSHEVITGFQQLVFVFRLCNDPCYVLITPHSSW